jgi:hypothetical protein
MEWTQLHIEGIKKACVRLIEFNQPIPHEVLATLNITTPGDNIATTNATSGASTTMTPFVTAIFTLELLKRIKEIACPNDCGHHGQCVNGTWRALCEASYIEKTSVT